MMSDSKYLVSVILPSHNSSRWIEASIQSVLSQSHTNLELIVVDDGSIDETVSLISKLAEKDSRITLISRQTCSGGPAKPRNEGIAAANGYYLAFIDSDDLWHSQKLELQLQALKTNDLNFLSSQCHAFNLAPPELASIAEPADVQLKKAKYLIQKNWVITSSAILETSLLGETRFNQKADYIGIEDYLMWLELHQKPLISSGVLMSPLVLYRRREDSLSASKPLMAKKIFYLLSNYTQKGEPLGVKKYYYFATYIIFAVLNRLT